ncbi:MAG: CPBP family intramembrane metalloprotease [Candidatus Lokiarchaeota archaeon]|nr:CPBP family intramembrane metalloprotease [Candidatus Lokiarchaeota archaeon]
MSKENEKQRVTKFCVYCGTTIEENTAYCPNPKCGKLVINIKPSEDSFEKQISTPKLKKKEVISRICSGCGSIITSSLLEQCPICDTKLEKSSEQKGEAQDAKPQRKTGYVFTNKKLVPEQRFILKRNEWNFREGISVFGNSLMAYITIRLIITMLLTLQLGSTDPLDLNITTILISQLPDIIFGLYPLYYIISKKHKSQKLGLMINTRYLVIALIIGIIASVGLILLDNFSSIIISFMYNSGIDFFDVIAYLEEEYLILQSADLIFIVLLIALISLSVISIEIAFRGVLHNTLKARFNNDFLGKSSTIVIVALIYSALFLFFTLPIGIYFFIPNFMVFLVLGITYEINHNLLSTIIANVAYNIFLIILIVYF